MRNITIHKTLYKFNELSEEARQCAIEERRHEMLNDYDYYEFYFSETIENVLERWNNTGIDIDIADVEYSIRYSQGDGVSFTTDTPININKALDFCKKEYPKYEKIIEDIKNNKNYKDILLDYEFTIKRNNYHYSHENTVHCDYIDITWNYTDGIWELADKIRQIIDKLKDDICNDIYHELMDIDQYITSDEHITELLESDNIEYTADGIIW